MERIRTFACIISFGLIQFAGIAQNGKLWTVQNELNTLNEVIAYPSKVSKQQVVELNTAAFQRKLLLQKPNESTEIEFPNPNGTQTVYKVKASNVMHPNLAKKFPTIKTYRGVSTDGKNRVVNFTVSPHGLFASIHSPEAPTVYIDPLTKDHENYRVYLKKDAKSNRAFECEVRDIVDKKSQKTAEVVSAKDLKLRTFRLALATTEEYSTFQVDQAGVGVGSTRTDSITAVMSAITVTMMRVNAIFERDLAITMQLVPNNDQLIFLKTDPGNDPYTNSNGSAMLTENQTAIDNIIQPANYDIGHVFSTAGGGVALKSTPCTANKAGGVTGTTSPIGDPFDVDYVAHEMGHQFGANHTFNGTSKNCSGTNRNNATAVEPGSGSTIMGYAGLCYPQNVQSSSDDYFHSVSISEIFKNITTGNSQCAQVTNFVGNQHVPVANAGPDYVIPRSTPFMLTGSGTDADNDILTYTWEQIDNEVSGISIPPSVTQTVGAVFRSSPPTVSNTRYFPDLFSVLSGATTTWEVLPNVARTINFALTVRDNAIGEGQTDVDEMNLTVSGGAGPFLVTSQNSTGIVWEKGTTETITWDVAGTTANGVNVSHVEILLSIDGGLSFQTVLASSTENDGSADVVVPDLPTGDARIMVRAIGNVFYAVNSKPFSIGSFETTCESKASSDVPLAIPDNNLVGVTSSITMTEDFLISDVNVIVEITHTWLWDLQVYLVAPDGTEVLLYDRGCGAASDRRQNINATFDDDASMTICLNQVPAVTGFTKPVEALSVLNGKSSVGDWKLKVVDNSSFDTGTIENWSLYLCQTNQTVSTEEFHFSSVLLYPNPATNEVRIKAQANNNSPTELSVYDLRGRLILREEYNTTGQQIDKVIKLDRLAKGLYFVNLKKGKAKSAHKLIVR
ncbi:M12 family metallo-peptidase [Flavobacteriaceae bacterium F08102]|nr:M12 family metallo-peptidase [Flavobacteriaceae bacterium F08102]